MSTLTAIPGAPVRTGRTITRRPRTFFDGTGGGPTLDDVVSGAWEELTAQAVVECPVCGDGELAPEYGAHARPVGGRCRGCGTTLS
ncbi:MAG: hypothetical protein M3065_01540 [Actinomycetota bacterium]|nr:hypothetical protein [Actinomycetota bacterium]